MISQYLKSVLYFLHFLDIAQLYLPAISMCVSMFWYMKQRNFVDKKQSILSEDCHPSLSIHVYENHYLQMLLKSIPF